jgi:sulfate adenylyltransferase subunit 2
MLYSIGKDSSCMLQLARKAWHPALPPFPLLHVDTTWKIRDMYAHRDRMARESGMQLLVHVNQDGLREGVSPVTHGSSYHTDVMKTVALKATWASPRRIASRTSGALRRWPGSWWMPGSS